MNSKLDTKNTKSLKGFSSIIFLKFFLLSQSSLKTLPLSLSPDHQHKSIPINYKQIKFSGKMIKQSNKHIDITSYAQNFTSSLAIVFFLVPKSFSFPLSLYTYTDTHRLGFYFSSLDDGDIIQFGGGCGKPKLSQVARRGVGKGDMCKRDHRQGGTITEESLDMLVAGRFAAQPDNHNTFTQQSHTFSQPQIPIL